MKKLGIGLTISAAVLGGFVMAQSMTSGSAETQKVEGTKLITEKEAREIALKKANGTIMDIDFDQDDNRPHYEFEIQNDTEEIDVEVDAKTGNATITDREKVGNDKDDQVDDVKASVSQSSASKQKEPVKQNETTEANIAKTQTTKPNTAPTQKESITKAEAIKIASTVAKGTVTNVELDNDDDVQTKTYELEFKDGNVEYDVEVDAYTGRIIEVNQDIED